MIRMMVCQMGGTIEDGKDIFQDGLIIMLEKIDDKDFALTCKFKTYLYCVCENLWKSVLEKRQAEANYFSKRIEEDESKDFTETHDGQIYEKIFKEVFETLDNAAKEILKLYWQELSPVEIAKRLGYTYGYVRKKKSEAQAELILKVKKHPLYKHIMKEEEVVVDEGP